MSKQTEITNTVPVQLLTFGAKRFKQTIKSHNEVLDKYYNGFENASNLKGDYKIFLDTNVLLRIYSTSFKAREKLLQFFKDYEKRIVLTAQVQWEFVKNRENVINTFSNEVTKTIPENFSSGILDNISNFQEKNKSKLIDYPDVDKKLKKLHDSAKNLLTEIETAIGSKNVSTSEILYKDEFIKIFNKLELLQPLPDEYLNAIKKEFDEFIKLLDKSDFDKEQFKTFPGCYERKEKSEDPYGDFVIYHEMLNYAKSNQTDLVFLTYDVTKGDWMQKSKNAHLHYVENFYLNTSQILFILDGQRTFDELLDINFKSLIKTTINDINSDQLTLQIFQEFLNDYPHFAGAGSYISDVIISELFFNGYNNLAYIEATLQTSLKYLPQIRRTHPSFSKLGLFRACMTAVDPSYKVYSSDGYIRMNYSKLDYTQPGVSDLADDKV
ncbi:hypothetical protein HDC90_003102 [Pedobacter sp. AK013]|uniref:PIN-like domain-containing protein n=1 Tax=Pedobacter sp. AK013 TaxID=2723071 RepID=UPI00161692F6|nr:PIN-like domain-containing protein [Pedobacter sp. AK013]MBB6238469.1 hypothetical protein [Pedobacter sp. AK013]